MKPRRPAPPRRRVALPAEVPVVASEAPPPPPVVETAPPEPTDMTEEEIVKMLKAAYT